MHPLTFRPLSSEDESLLWPMLMHAAHEPALSAVQANPALVRYVAGWGRVGDCGWAAMRSEQIIGAAWVRLWPDDFKGYGFVDDAIPELALAVMPSDRGQGIGTRLLKQLMATTRKQCPGISLSVRSDNSAIRLYERLGFVKVADSEVDNRVGGQSYTMIYRYYSG